jgi:hypothetical protein
MRKVALIVALLACAAAVAVAQVQNMGTYYKNPQSGQVTDALGNAQVSEAIKDRDNWIVYPTAINDTISNGQLVGTAWALANTAAQFCAESTVVYPCGQYRRFALGARWIPAGGDTSTATIRIAFQVRGHFTATADTSTTFYWDSWTLSSAAGTTTDSVGVGTTAQAGNLALAWSGEKIIAFDPRRGNGGATINTFSQFFGAPAGKLIDLVDAKGNYFWAPYISVRARVINGYGANATKGRLIVSLAMGS